MDMTAVSLSTSIIDISLHDYWEFNYLSFADEKAAPLIAKHGFAFVHCASFKNASYIYLHLNVPLHYMHVYGTQLPGDKTFQKKPPLYMKALYFQAQNF